MLRRLFQLIFVAVVLLGLPLVGVVFSGYPLGQYLEFPPVTRYVEHADFSWVVFVLMGLGILVSVVPFKIRVGIESVRVRPCPSRNRFPWWGWAGAAWTLSFWIIAWNRFSWTGVLQHHTFTPLWLGYILIVNALKYRRSGRSMLTAETGYFLSLFVLSAVFWWFFEYLNRFVQNWYYVGVDSFTALEYFLYATLSFSTVLPAVLGTYDLLETYPRLSAGLDRYRRVRVAHGKRFAFGVLLPASAGLALIGVWPDYLFPLLWVAPLIILVCMQALMGETTIFQPLRGGDWRRIFLLAISALICGSFWEMWNFHSAAKWIYSVPFVNRFLIFEMPVLGYAGYLPFGLECAVVSDFFLRRRSS